MGAPPTSPTHTAHTPRPLLPGDVCQLRPPINILLEEENITELSTDVSSAILTCNLQKLKGRERWKGGWLGGRKGIGALAGGGEEEKEEGEKRRMKGEQKGWEARGSSTQPTQGEQLRETGGGGV